MSVKASISLTESQETYARALVASGRYASLSAVVQQGLELLREKAEAEEAETAALRVLLAERGAGPFVPAGTLDDQLAEMMADKRRARGVAG